MNELKDSIKFNNFAGSGNRNLIVNNTNQVAIGVADYEYTTFGASGAYTTLALLVASGNKKAIQVGNATEITNTTITYDLEIINYPNSGYYIDFATYNFTISDTKSFILNNCHLKYANANPLNVTGSLRKDLVFRGNCQITNESSSGNYLFASNYGAGMNISFETLTYNVPNRASYQAFCSAGVGNSLKGNKYILNVAGITNTSCEFINSTSEINIIQITGTCGFAGTNSEHLQCAGKVNEIYSLVNQASVQLYDNSSPRVNLTGTNSNLTLSNRDTSNFTVDILEINSTNVKTVSNGTCIDFFNDYTNALKVNFNNVRFTKTTSTFNIYSAGCKFIGCFFGNSVKIWKSTNAVGYGKDNIFDNCTFGVTGDNNLITIYSDTFNIIFINNKVFGTLIVAGANHTINNNYIGETNGGTKTITLQSGCSKTNCIGNNVESANGIIYDVADITNNIENTQIF